MTTTNADTTIINKVPSDRQINVNHRSLNNISHRNGSAISGLQITALLYFLMPTRLTGSCAG
jgi:hypothetical protein